MPQLKTNESYTKAKGEDSRSGFLLYTAVSWKNLDSVYEEKYLFDWCDQ